MSIRGSKDDSSFSDLSQKRILVESEGKSGFRLELGGDRKFCVLTFRGRQLLGYICKSGIHEMSRNT